ncbi:hypothetical protein [Pseudonocardia acaciae]|uniref:hypothetical protein n=1 Tax=Pseudonocardia acaciae TaxID=551276 RepID=UPI000B2F4CE7|nr:hypothetical protein [Pseudonocardia acaciae]
MLDLGAAEKTDPTDDPAEELVGALSSRAVEDGAPARAAAEIRRRQQAGETPIGLYRLSEALAVPASTPAPRQPAGDSEAVVEVVRRYPCAVLEAGDAPEVARSLAAVLADGKRVLVSGGDTAELIAVRAALPTSLSGLCLDGPLPLSDAELRELRTLLATATPEQRTRLDQVLPDPSLVPSADQVAQLCRTAGRQAYPARDGADLIRELLGQLDPERLSGVLAAARRAQTALADLEDGDGDPPYSRALLERVLFGTARPELDALVRRTSEIVRSSEELDDVGDHMAVLGTLPRAAVAQLREYADYLDGGGRARSYFRSPQQRAVEPVLRQLRIGGAPLKDSRLLRQALAFVELVRAMEELGSRCDRLGVPRPADVPAVEELNRQLERVQGAARAAEGLRHEVLFINPRSPLTVPDLASVERVARTIVDSGGADNMARARRRLMELADALAGAVPASRAAPEVGELVRALRAMNLNAYLDALAPLAAASREKADQKRLVELLSRLREGAPDLAETWADVRTGQATPGTVRFVPLDELLGALPEPDHADLVLLLDAGSLGTENMLVAAAAPRLLAVSSSGSSKKAGSETVLSALRQAGVPVVAPAASSGSSGESSKQNKNGEKASGFSVPAPRTASR